jgi:hypothetical protein
MGREKGDSIMKRYTMTELSKMNKPQLVVNYLDLQKEYFSKEDKKTSKITVMPEITEEKDEDMFRKAVEEIKVQPKVQAKVEYIKPQGIIAKQVKDIAYYYTNYYLGSNYFKPIIKPATYTDAATYIAELFAMKDTLREKPAHDKPLYWTMVMRVCRDFADMNDPDIQAFYYDVKDRHEANGRRYE